MYHTQSHAHWEHKRTYTQEVRTWYILVCVMYHTQSHTHWEHKRTYTQEVRTWYILVCVMYHTQSHAHWEHKRTYTHEVRTWGCILKVKIVFSDVDKLFFSRLLLLYPPCTGNLHIYLLKKVTYTQDVRTWYMRTSTTLRQSSRVQASRWYLLGARSREVTFPLSWISLDLALDLQSHIYKGIFLKLWSKVLQIFLLFSLYFSSLNLKYLKLTKLDITRFAMKLFICINPSFLFFKKIF